MKKKKLGKNLKRLIILFFVFGMGVIGINLVKAGGNDSSMLKNRVEGVYAVTKLNGTDRIFHLNMYTMNGRVAYCIEIGVDIDTAIYNSTYDFSISNLSEQQIKYIRNLSYFGYGYEGHKDYRYYMATQELIWEYLNDIDVSWTNELNVDGEKININNYKQEITSLVNGYNQQLKFAGYNRGGNVIIGERRSFMVSGGSLAYYEILPGEHYTASIDGRTLTIDFGTDYLGYEFVYLIKKKFYGYDSLLYYKGESQKLISNGDIDERVGLLFNIIGRNITFLIVDNSGIKSNNQNDFKGISYELSLGDDKVYELNENDNGKISFEDGVFGNYCVKQISTNDAYELNDEEICFEFNENFDDVVYLEVNPVLYDLQILKLYGKSNDLQVEEGVIFDIYNYDGSLYERVITDDSGMINMKIPYGKYFVKQISGKSGYEMVEDFEVLAIGDNKELKYTLVDKSVLVDLIINSRDVENNLIRDNDIIYKIVNVETNEYVKIDGKSEFRNNDGKVLVEDIEYGNYVVEIIDNSLDYERIIDKIEVYINDDSDFKFHNGKLEMEVDANYSLVKGGVKIRAYEEIFVSNEGSFYYKYVNDGGSKFDLVSDENIMVNGEIIYKKGDKILDIVTNDNGEYVIGDLYRGKYVLISEYGVKKEFYINNKVIVDVEFKKKAKKGEGIIYNIADDGDGIENSVIDIYDENNEVIFVGITNDRGMIDIKDLVVGDYCFRQKKVDNKYIFNDNKYCFSISDDKIVELEIVNKLKKEQEIEVPNTFNEGKKVFKLIITILVGGIGVIFLTKKVIKREL